MLPRAPRTVCLDLDTFFVSVERLLDPSLEGKQVVVGATPGGRGVVTACSYEVRPLGVHSGMGIAEAVRLAPDAIYLPTGHSRYSPFSKRVRAVLERFCPEVSPASIDEFYLDFSGCERMYAQPGDADGDATILRVVQEIRAAVRHELGLPASAGIGCTRSIAKVASGRAKPDGALMIHAGQELAFLAPLPVRKFPGIGPVAASKLRAAGIDTLGQLIDLPAGRMQARFGALSASVRKRATGAGGKSGVRSRPAFMEDDPRGTTVGSISNERTFRADVGEQDKVEDQLRKLSERVCWRARKREVSARTVGLKLRFSDFTTLSRSKTIAPTNDEQAVFGTILALYRAAARPHQGVRLVGVVLTNFVGADRQLGLPFAGDGVGPGGRRRPAVGQALDQVRERFGYDAIRLGVAGERSRWQA